MDAMTWEILAAATIFAAGIVAYFELSLRRPENPLPSKAVTSELETQQLITMLESPPLNDAQTTVKAGASYQSKKAKGE